MQKRNLLLLTCMCFSLLLSAQTIPNLSFEDWETSTSGRYEEPSDGIWATGNSPVDIPIAAPPVIPTSKTTDAVDGTYAVKLETITLLFNLASATIFTGEFDLDILNPSASAKFGVPYSDRPYSLSGFYKYNALMGDSCDMYITLFNSNLNTTTWRGDTVAHAQIRSNQEVPSYSPFELILDYVSAAQVDTIQIIFASSAGGGNFEGQEGAALYVDGLTINMPTGIKQVLMPEIKVNTFPNPAQEYLNIELDKPLLNGSFEIFSNDGRKIMTEAVNAESFTIKLNDFVQGTYHYMLLDNNGGAMNSGSFVVGQ